MDADLRQWMDRTAGSLGGGYRVVAGDGAVAWVTDVDDAELARCERFAHHALHRVGEILPELDLTPPLGRWPVVLCASRDDLLACLTRDDDDDGAGAEALAAIVPGGVWISQPVGHFLMPHSRVDTLDGALAHELVHAALRELPTPRWLEEGLATSVETAMGHLPHPLADRDEIMAFRAWAAERDPAQLVRPEDFWNSDSSRYAYALAQVMVTQLLHDRERFVAYLHTAHRDDNGDAALRLVYRHSLAELTASAISPPRPRSWLARLFNAAFGVE